MTNQETIRYFETLLTHVDMRAVSGLEAEEAIQMAISALQAQEIRDLPVSPLLDKKKKKRKREKISALEAQELATNSPKLDSGNGEFATNLQPTCKQLATDTISRQAAKLKVARVIWEDGDSCYDFHDKCVDCLDDVPSAQPEPLLDEIVDEIRKTIAETESNGKYHADPVRHNGEMICHGLEIALNIIEEKRNE